MHQEQKRRFSAEKRERYWREKFENESIEVQNDVNSDLTCIFQGVVKEKVPEETAPLWEQQKKIMHTKSKRGYRWNPKKVGHFSWSKYAHTRTVYLFTWSL